MYKEQLLQQKYFWLFNELLYVKNEDAQDEAHELFASAYYNVLVHVETH